MCFFVEFPVAAALRSENLPACSLSFICPENTMQRTKWDIGLATEISREARDWKVNFLP